MRTKAEIAAYQKKYRELHKEELALKKSIRGKLYRETHREELAARRKKYKAKHKEKIGVYQRAYDKRRYEERKVELLAKKRVYRAEHKDVISAQRKVYRAQNKEKIAAYQKEYIRNRIKADPVFKLTYTLRARLTQALKAQDTRKCKRSAVLVGCTIEELKRHLEKQFKPRMTWENHGVTGWHIDHIRPCASFDLTKEEEQKACFHHTNLQPLWWQENLQKSSSSGPKPQES